MLNIRLSSPLFLAVMQVMKTSELFASSMPNMLKHTWCGVISCHSFNVRSGRQLKTLNFISPKVSMFINHRLTMSPKILTYAEPVSLHPWTAPCFFLDRVFLDSVETENQNCDSSRESELRLSDRDVLSPVKHLASLILLGARQFGLPDFRHANFETT